MTLAETLRWIMEENGIKISKLVEESGVSQRTVYSLLGCRKRKSKPHEMPGMEPATAIRIGRALSISPRLLMRIDVDDRLRAAGWDPLKEPKFQHVTDAQARSWF